MIPHSENRLTCKDKNAIYKGFKNVYEGEMQKCVKNNVVESFVFSLQCSLAHLKQTLCLSFYVVRSSIPSSAAWLLIDRLFSAKNMKIFYSLTSAIAE